MGKGRQDAALAIVVVFPCVSVIIVALRCWSRYLGRNFGRDDTLMLIALLLAIAESVCGYGLTLTSWSGYHYWQIPKMTIGQTVISGEWSFAYQMFYHPMMGIIRWSIIVFLYRVQDLRRHIQLMLHIVWWINMGYIIGTTLANLLQCTPVSYAWDRSRTDKVVDGKTIPGGTCIQSLPFILSSCGLSIFMDIIIIPIPTLMVWRLGMERKTKIAVAFLMSLGWVATGVSVGRFIVYYQRWQPTLVDRSYNIGHTISVAEANTAIIAGCAPALKRLFHHFFPTYFSPYATRQSQDGVKAHDGADASPAQLDEEVRDVELGNQKKKKKKPKADVDMIYAPHLDTASESQEHINVARTISTRTRSMKTSTSMTDSEVAFRERS